MSLSDLPQLAALSTAEKLQLVEDLWDDIASAPEGVPLPDWQKEELARRKAAFEATPQSGRTWDEVKTHARRSLSDGD
ncbi:MAG TPA: addiction module protein [Planctomycetaceae bacterium]